MAWHGEVPEDWKRVDLFSLRSSEERKKHHKLKN